METKQKSNVFAIGVMFLLFFMIAFVTNFAGSMGVIVQNQFGASNAMAQLGTLANFIAYACMGIPGGLILKRKGYKFTSLLAAAIGFVGVGIQFASGYAESFGVYVLGAFVAGFSMCLLNLVVNPMLNTLGGGGNRGNQLIQLGGSCNSIGGTIAPIFLGYLIGGQAATASVGDAAPAMIAAMAIFALAFVIIGLSAIPEPHMETAEEKAARLSGNAKKDAYGPMSFRHFVMGAIAIFFYVGVEVGIPNIANLYMSNLDWVGPTVAGTLVGFYWFLMMCGRLVGGAVGGKVSSKAMLSTVCTVAIVFVLAIMFIPETVKVTVPVANVEVPLSMMFMFLCGLCTSVMWGAIFNLAAEGLGKYTPAASGIFMALVCGGGVLPFIQGLVADAAGFINSYWVVIIGLGYMLFYALVGSKNVNKDIPVE
ncbi:MAG: MFS transporter [Alistipes sp.]|nr:MFS transporter [Alistipes sp.]MBO5984397.1 MFS transporter [Rikenellaceae bacterium]MBQ6582050.1 MFS transporter [Alistipes sp.]